MDRAAGDLWRQASKRGFKSQIAALDFKIQSKVPNDVRRLVLLRPAFFAGLDFLCVGFGAEGRFDPKAAIPSW